MASHGFIMAANIVYHTLSMLVHQNYRESVELILGTTILMGLMLAFSTYNSRINFRISWQLEKNHVAAEVTESFSLLTVKELTKQTIVLQLGLLILLTRWSIASYLVLIAFFVVQNAKTIVLANQLMVGNPRDFLIIQFVAVVISIDSLSRLNELNMERLCFNFFIVQQFETLVSAILVLILRADKPEDFRVLQQVLQNSTATILYEVSPLNPQEPLTMKPLCSNQEAMRILGNFEELEDFMEIKTLIPEVIQEQRQMTTLSQGYHIEIWPFTNKVLITLRKEQVTQDQSQQTSIVIEDNQIQEQSLPKNKCQVDFASLVQNQVIRINSTQKISKLQVAFLTTFKNRPQFQKTWILAKMFGKYANESNKSDENCSRSNHKDFQKNSFLLESVSSISCALHDEYQSQSQSHNFELPNNSTYFKKKNYFRKQSNLNPNIEKKILQSIMSKRNETQEFDPSIINLFKLNESLNSGRLKQMVSLSSFENGGYSEFAKLLSVNEKESMISILESNASALFQDKVITLQRVIAQNKQFLFMIVHDLRNPAMSIKFGIQETLDCLKSDIKKHLNKKLSLQGDLIEKGFATSQYGSMHTQSEKKSQSPLVNSRTMNDIAQFEQAKHKINENLKKQIGHQAEIKKNLTYQKYSFPAGLAPIFEQNSDSIYKKESYINCTKFSLPDQDLESESGSTNKQESEPIQKQNSIKVVSDIIAKIKAPETVQSGALLVSQQEREAIENILDEFISMSHISLNAQVKNERKAKKSQFSSINASEISISEQYELSESKNRRVDFQKLNSDSIKAKQQMSAIMNSVIQQSAINQVFNPTNSHVPSRQGSFSSEEEAEPDFVKYIHSLKHKEVKKNLNRQPEAKIIDSCPQSDDLFSARSILMTTRNQLVQKATYCNSSTQTYITKDNITEMQINLQEKQDQIYQLQQQFMTDESLVTLQKSTVDKIERLLHNSLFSTKMLTNLINDLLDMAKFEQGKFTLNECYFSLPILIHKSLNVIKYFADEKKIKLKIMIQQKSEFIEVNISDSESLMKINQNNVFTNLFGDERRYLQILLNFVSNALKFSNEGGTITIRLKLMEQQRIEKQSSNNLQKSFCRSKSEARLFGMRKLPIRRALSCDSAVVSDNHTDSSGKLRKDIYQIMSDQNENSSSSSASLSDLDVVIKEQDKEYDSDSNSVEANIASESQMKLSPKSNCSEFDISCQSEIGENTKYKEERFIKFRIDIIDTGVGIEDDNLDKLFLDFSKLDEHENINQVGTGLGLSICKKIIEQMGGSVNVKSKVNIGTTFSINLNTKIQKVSNKPPRLSSLKLSGSNISKSESCISKSKIQNANIVLLQDSLQNLEYINDLVDNSESGIIKRVPGVSSSGSGGALENRSSKGHSEITVTNINQRRSVQKEQIEEPSQVRPEISQVIAEPILVVAEPQIRHRCIVANDDSFQLMACKLNLEKFNIEVIPAVNGFEAVQKVKQAISQNIEINFVLLDLNMPILDGYKACVQINKIYKELQYYQPPKISKPVIKKSSSLNKVLQNKLAENQLPQNAIRKVSNQINNALNIYNQLERKRPLIFAFSALINEQITLKCKKNGFNFVIEAPLTTQSIKNEIIPEVEIEAGIKQDLLDLPVGSGRVIGI